MKFHYSDYFVVLNLKLHLINIALISFLEYFVSFCISGEVCMP